MSRRFFIRKEGKYVAVPEREYLAARSSLARRGLGDRVAAVLQPVAKAIDFVLGTKIAQCVACKKRRQALNKIRF